MLNLLIYQKVFFVLIVFLFYFVIQSTFMNNKIEKEQLAAISEMRDMMQRSSRFLSLSGLAGILVGFVALVGVAIAYYILEMPISSINYLFSLEKTLGTKENTLLYIIINCVSVLTLSLTIGTFLAIRNAKRKGLSIGDKTTQRLVINMFIPLLIGGLFIMALLFHHQYSLILPSMLIFYGMALLNASKYSIEDIRYLGIIEMFLGLLSMFLLDQALIIWAIGFGILHMIYGVILYNKYEK
jgi:predicted lysophospholipase L1 biosynthesis ABC-type transport system permease subunit